VISCVVVVEDDRPCGVLTERDVVRLAAARSADVAACVRTVMATPITTATPDTTGLDALRVMREHGFRRLPVVETDGGLAGIVTQTDLVQSLLAYLQQFTLHEVLDRLMQLDVGARQREAAMATLSEQFRKLDVHCAELLGRLRSVTRHLA